MKLRCVMPWNPTIGSTEMRIASIKCKQHRNKIVLSSTKFPKLSHKGSHEMVPNLSAEQSQLLSVRVSARWSQWQFCYCLLFSRGKRVQISFPLETKRDLFWFSLFCVPLRQKRVGSPSPPSPLYNQTAFSVDPYTHLPCPAVFHRCRHIERRAQLYAAYDCMRNWALLWMYV